MPLERRSGMLVAAATVAALLGLLFTQVIAQGGTEPTRRPEPAATEILSDLPHIGDAIDAGKDVNIVVPTPNIAPSTPVIHGPYRLIPDGFKGTLSSVPLPGLPADPGPRGDLAEFVVNSSLWLTPGVLPEGVEPEAHRFLSEGNEFFVAAWYPIVGSQAELLIARQRQLSDPIDFPFNFGSRNPFQLELIELDGGRYGLVVFERPLAAGAAASLDFDSRITGYRYVRVHDPITRVETIVEALDGAPDLTPQELINLVETLG